MKKIKYIISGYEPVDKEINEFMRSVDMPEVYFKIKHEVVTTFKKGATPEQIERTPEAIKKAFEAMGCKKIIIDRRMVE